MVSGADSFSWIQWGHDNYDVTQSNGGSHPYSLAMSVTMGDSWNDQGTDTLGSLDSITGGTDVYTWNQTSWMSYAVSDGGTYSATVSGTTSTYTLAGNPGNK